MELEYSHVQLRLDLAELQVLLKDGVEGFAADALPILIRNCDLLVLSQVAQLTHGETYLVRVDDCATNLLNWARFFILVAVLLRELPLIRLLDFFLASLNERLAALFVTRLYIIEELFEAIFFHLVILTSIRYITLSLRVDHDEFGGAVLCLFFLIRA